MPKLDPAKVSAADAARKGDRKVKPADLETPDTSPDPDSGDDAGEGDVNASPDLSSLSREKLEKALAKARKKTRRLEREHEKRGLSKDEAARVADSLAEMRGEVKRLGDALAAKGDVAPATSTTTTEGAPAGASPAAPASEPFLLTLAESLFW